MEGNSLALAPLQRYFSKHSSITTNSSKNALSAKTNSISGGGSSVNEHRRIKAKKDEQKAKMRQELGPRSGRKT